MAITPAQLRAFANLAPEAALPDTTLQMFCTYAAIIVVEDLEDSPLSDDRLELIELNLAAHFALVGLERGGLTGQIVGTSEEQYYRVPPNKSGLGTTLFGQQAISLDTSGVLEVMGASTMKARFEVV